MDKYIIINNIGWDIFTNYNLLLETECTCDYSSYKIVEYREVLEMKIIVLSGLGERTHSYYYAPKLFEYSLYTYYSIQFRNKMIQ